MRAIRVLVACGALLAAAFGCGLLDTGFTFSTDPQNFSIDTAALGPDRARRHQDPVHSLHHGQRRLRPGRHAAPLQRRDLRLQGGLQRHELRGQRHRRVRRARRCLEQDQEQHPGQRARHCLAAAPGHEDQREQPQLPHAQPSTSSSGRAPRPRPPTRAWSSSAPSRPSSRRHPPTQDIVTTPEGNAKLVRADQELHGAVQDAGQGEPQLRRRRPYPPGPSRPRRDRLPRSQSVAAHPADPRAAAHAAGFSSGTEPIVEGAAGAPTRAGSGSGRAGAPAWRRASGHRSRVP